MIEFILMLLGLAFPNNNANTATCPHNNGTQITIQTSSSPAEGLDPGGPGGGTTGDTGQTPPPFTNP
ncbi:hypothetical protein MTQ00_15355 [Chryseobacterium sp. B21-037]|uniref:hypothetical protein n=1 Tax=Chryseobacterium sp. B21-037 TaxID=2926038 RepID=UPI0023592629|nr:hypothetical protein [Chryseobacterium sp. B21-037]MDC8105908.1 hypothetical protein [Chryseobacterium sp. B21-037]